MSARVRWVAVRRWDERLAAHWLLCMLVGMPARYQLVSRLRNDIFQDQIRRDETLRDGHAEDQHQHASRATFETHCRMLLMQISHLPHSSEQFNPSSTLQSVYGRAM
jgi:hypothetical protein